MPVIRLINSFINKPFNYWNMQEYVTDLCVEDGKGLRRVQRDENSNQELLVFSLQGQGEAIYDAGEEKKTI